MRVVLLTLGLLLVLSTPAWGSCAWVLWSRHIAKDNTWISWSPLDGFQTKAECDRALSWQENKDSKKPPAQKKVEAFFTCFPDTIDPRERKP